MPGIYDIWCWTKQFDSCLLCLLSQKTKQQKQKQLTNKLADVLNIYCYSYFLVHHQIFKLGFMTRFGNKTTPWTHPIPAEKNLRSPDPVISLSTQSSHPISPNSTFFFFSLPSLFLNTGTSGGFNWKPKNVWRGGSLTQNFNFSSPIPSPCRQLTPVHHRTPSIHPSMTRISPFIHSSLTLLSSLAPHPFIPRSLYPLTPHPSLIHPSSVLSHMPPWPSPPSQIWVKPLWIRSYFRGLCQ